MLKDHNPALAIHLWPEKTKPSEIFEYVFFVSAPTSVKVSVSQLNQLLGSHYRGAPQGTQFLKDSKAQILRVVLFQAKGDLDLLGDKVNDEILSRGGDQTPKPSPYEKNKKPAYGSGDGKVTDPEVRRQNHERRNEAHRATLDSVADATDAVSVGYEKTQYADLVVIPKDSENVTAHHEKIWKSLEKVTTTSRRAQRSARLYFYKLLTLIYIRRSARSSVLKAAQASHQWT